MSPLSNQYGSYLSTKKVNFNHQSTDGIEPTLVDETRQKNKDVIDLRVHKKGLNYHGYDSKKMKKENEEIDGALEKY